MPLIRKPTLADIRARLAPVRARLAPRVALGRYWPRAKETSLDAWKRSAPVREWISHHPNLAIAPAMVVAIIVLLIARQVAVAATLIGAWFVLARGISQGSQDFRRRINETYSKAVSQLASDKLEERLGGIYTLENISKESTRDYWTVMENLTAFVRERTQRMEAERTAKLDQRIAERAYFLWEQAGRPEGRSAEFWSDAVRQEKDGEPPATDIAAVLTVIKRRDEEHRALETRNDWRLDFRQAVLRRVDLYEARLEGAWLSAAHLEGAWLYRAHLEDAILWFARLEGANLDGAHLEGADLYGAHLEGANLPAAHLEGANLETAHLEGAWLISEAHLEGAKLERAHLEGANLHEAHLEGAALYGAHLEGATLYGAHLEDANLWFARLKGANLDEAHLEGADLKGATGLTQEQIDSAFGDAATQLPEGLCRPKRWTAPVDGPAPEQRDLP
jgi:uncharacterized protein YjbI with pentapeptide repeats